MSAPFKVALFSDPPSVFSIIVRLLQAKIELASVVSFFPRGNILKIPEPIKKLLDERKIPFFTPETLKSVKFQNELLKTNPSVIVTFGLLEKIPNELLNKIPHGGLNWHPSLLPRYRGPFPCFWPIAKGEKETGVSIHEMTDTLDGGDIYFREKIKINPNETHGTLWQKCEEAGIKLMLLALSELERGKKLPRIPQDEKNASYAPFPSPNDLQIDWKKPAHEIFALIRAASPLLGASFNHNGQSIRVWSAKITRPNDRALPPGTVVTSNGLFEVAASDQLLSLETLQIGLLRFASGQEFLSISGIREGERLWKQP